MLDLIHLFAEIAKLAIVAVGIAVLLTVAGGMQ